MLLTMEDVCWKAQDPFKAIPIWHNTTYNLGIVFGFRKLQAEMAVPVGNILLLIGFNPWDGWIFAVFQMLKWMPKAVQIG